ncbi:Predicted transcriptional regulator containing CBS domains [Paenibacillus catalpae]|uniref:Predicted transcriptional regulator containing CBS domains n=1 Tax=Paenibacillus catalpae TaxID=1045775 RepID=A0A1I1YSL9_9BACL|nr:DRTGG domain-containing protein [Paenibacillus catalpae]SFE22594.1 Predicted transcriptional regulator containing CBS domains [Paenibacillus catalpae]
MASVSGMDTSTKREQILQYIETLNIGEKISVRAIARALGVSEGTAYKAIKEAEASGLVSTKERIGTVRIDRKRREALDQLTFGEVAEIVEGHLFGGASGLDKSLHKFVIGAMELDAMLRYIDVGSLLIVGNRVGAHRCALEQGAGVLITGGFEPSQEVKALADENGLPIISSRHDTFTVASMINRAMYDRLIKRKIMLIEDLMTFSRPADVLRSGNTLLDFHNLSRETGNYRFPVIDDRGRVVGMMTSKDATGSPDDYPIDKIMTRHPITAAPNIAVTSAAHTMAAEGIDLLPIVDRHRKLLGVVTRQQLLEALRFAGKQQESGETFDDLMWAGFEAVEVDGTPVYKGAITPQMSGSLGMVSEGILVTLMTQAGRRMIRDAGKRDYLIDGMTAFFIKPVQIDSQITIVPRALEMSRKATKLEIELIDQTGLAAKAMMTAQMIDSY